MLAVQSHTIATLTSMHFDSDHQILEWPEWDPYHRKKSATKNEM